MLFLSSRQKTVDTTNAMSITWLVRMIANTFVLFCRIQILDMLARSSSP